MRIVDLAGHHLDAAAELVAAGVAALTRALPAVPSTLADPAAVRPMLARHAARHGGLAAEADGGRLAGFLGWHIVPSFRDAERRTAYVPDWCHGFAADRLNETHRPLYRAAAAIWTAASCAAHAVTLPATAEAERALWFENGFGLFLVDVVAWTASSAVATPPPGVTIRRAEPADADALARLDAALSAHLAAPPVLMRRAAASAEACAAFLAVPGNAAWIAIADDRPVGYLRIAADGDGAACVQSADGAGIHGAHVDPAWRGHGIGTALLDAARADLAARGVPRWHAEYESSNPEAAAFWPRHMAPAAHSLLRVPEWLPSGGA